MTSDQSRGNVFHLIFLGLANYLRPYWREHVILVITVFVAVFSNVAIPLFLRKLIDEAIPQRDALLLTQVMGLMLLVFLISVLSEVAQVYTRAQFGSELKKDLRIVLFSHLQRLPATFYDRLQPGEITALFAKELLTLRAAWRNLTILGLYAILQILTTCGAILFLDRRLFVAVLFILPIMFVVQLKAINRSEMADYDDKYKDAKVAFAVQDAMLPS